jgi:hypothetical protein
VTTLQLLYGSEFEPIFDLGLNQALRVIKSFCRGS